MAEPLVNVITPATSVALISLDDAKIMLGLPAGPAAEDAQLQMLLDQNSMILARKANRETFAKEKVSERWDCVGPVCCPNGACRIWLTRAPVKLADIETLESPEGVAIDKASIRLEQSTGQIVFPGGCADEILITYTGGFLLPDEAPLDLQRAAGMELRQYQTQAAQEATSGAGIRLLQHKENRIVYFSPRDMAGGGSSSASTGTPSSATDAAVKSLIQTYVRYWI
jgi:hypothetical protein